MLHVITTLNRGGAENHLVLLLKKMVEKGFSPAVAYLQGHGYWRKELEQRGIEVFDLGLPWRRYGDPRPIFRLAELIKKWRPDIIHAHMPPAELYTRLALLGLKEEVPLIISKHNTQPFYPGPGESYIARWVAGRAKKIIAISKAVQNYMVTREKIPRKKFVVVHYGLDPSPFESVQPSQFIKWRRVWKAAPDALIIGTVARLVPQKALHIMLEAFSIYLHSSSKAKLVIVGEGPLKKNLQNLANKLGISSQVIWAGFQEDIPAIMNAFDIFALSSEWEGFGMVLLEAMAAKKPIIATRVDAIPEIVEHQVTGLLVPPRASQAMAEAFSFFEDTRRRAQYGKAGFLRLKRYFTLDQMTDKTLQVYHEAWR